MKFYARNYKTKGIPVMFPVIENITSQRYEYFPNEFGDMFHINNHFL